MKAKRVGERAWIRQVMADYEVLHQQVPLCVLQIEAYPDWVCCGLMPLMGISHPKLLRIPLRKWTARDLGYFLGRQSGLDSMMWGEVPLSQELLKEAKQSLEAQWPPAGQISPASEQATKRLFSGLPKWRARFKKFIDAVVLAARARPYVEAAAFLHGFSDGNTVTDADFDNRKIGVNERIAWVILLFWRKIATFESVGQLHRILAAAAQPMGIVITLKRVEKLCARIGLRFRGRGRPKKKNPTAPPRRS